MINVLVVDDRELVRSGIAALLSQDGGIRITGEANSGEAAISLIGSGPPDIVLMDIHMPGIGGIEATRRLRKRFPSVKVIAVTARAHEPLVMQLMDAGAWGCVSKDSPRDEMIHAVKTVHAGKRFVAPVVAQELVLSRLDGANGSPFRDLSRRETQIVMMVAEGGNNRDIADRLCLSPKTVCTYRYRLYEKLNVTNDVELTRAALRYGLVGNDG